MRSDDWVRRLAPNLAAGPGGAVVQVAADGAWESCRRAPLTALDADAGRALVGEVVHAAVRDVAIEVWWPGQGFVGTRWLLHERAEAVAGLERLLAAPAADPAALLAAAAGGPIGPVTSAEVGAVNAWRSTGPVVVWRRDRPIDVAAALHHHPRLRSCHRPVVVEFATDDPRAAWLAVQISRPDGERHRLDEHRLAECLAVVT